MLPGLDRYASSYDKAQASLVKGSIKAIGKHNSYRSGLITFTLTGQIEVRKQGKEPE